MPCEVSVIRSTKKETAIVMSSTEQNANLSTVSRYYGLHMPLAVVSKTWSRRAELDVSAGFEQHIVIPANLLRSSLHDGCRLHGRADQGRNYRGVWGEQKHLLTYLLYLGREKEKGRKERDAIKHPLPKYMVTALQILIVNCGRIRLHNRVQTI